MGPGGLLLLLLAAVGGAGAESPGLCEPHGSCEQCVRAHPRCAWCQEPDFPRGGWADAPRCAPREVLEGAGCPPGAVLHPQGSVRVLRDEGGGPGGSPLQLRPQSIRVLLRPGEERAFGVRFRRARAPPVDLYYLLDASASMRDDLRRLQRLGHRLLDTLRNVSAAARIGFGSFVDKPVLPYVSTAPPRLRNPCPEHPEPCAPAVAFRHVLSLTADAGEFAEHVGRQRISGNLDAAEGTFDAIMQVAVCQERIGWRPATRLLLVASDDTFHSAGDGKLGGIVLPSDTRCHLDATGVYNRSHLYDYPSVGHLAQALAAAHIQPIFAVTAPALPVYQELSHLIPKSVVGELQEDSSNVVQLIAHAYDSLLSSVELQHPPLPPGISLSYESHCGDPPESGDPPEPPRSHGGRCDGVKVNQEVTFTVRVRADACLGSRQRVGLRVLGVPEELSLELGTLCGCPCAPPQPQSPHCHGGTLLCGACRCLGGRGGRRCECEGPGPGPGGGCRPPNSTGPPCSGRGRCVCGGCRCPPGLSGTLCQCDSGGCQRHGGLPCGGPERGECVCGTCRCHPGFGGPACGCPLGRGGCVRGGRECSGRGRCVCGTCHCHPGFGGPLCAHCHHCHSPCQRHRDCAHCSALGGGNCSSACAGATPRLLPAAPPAPPDPPRPPVWCREEAEDGRVLLFLIEGAGDEDTEVTLTVWTEEAGPPPWLVAGLVAGPVAVGLVVLGLLRLGLELRDRRELGASSGNVTTGPRSATTTTVNPRFLPG